jgi:hypothetical protein
MADGKTRLISQIKTGDKVADASPAAGSGTQDQSHTVTATHVTYTDRDYVNVTIATGDGPETVIGTAHHLYWDATVHSWTRASELKVGHRLQTSAGATVLIVALHAYTAHVTTYNLTVDTAHTYYVVAGATPILVHNCEVDVEGVLNELSSKRVTTGRIFDAAGVAVHAELQAGGVSDLVRATDAYLRQYGAPINPKAEYYPAAQHVEAQYAMWMRQNGITDATVIINKVGGVCGGMYGCDKAVKAILPRGSTMTVWYPGAQEPEVLPGEAALVP